MHQARLGRNFTDMGGNSYRTRLHPKDFSFSQLVNYLVSTTTLYKIESFEISSTKSFSGNSEMSFFYKFLPNWISQSSSPHIRPKTKETEKRRRSEQKDFFPSAGGGKFFPLPASHSTLSFCFGREAFPSASLKNEERKNSEGVKMHFANFPRWRGFCLVGNCIVGCMYYYLKS